MKSDYDIYLVIIPYLSALDASLHDEVDQERESAVLGVNRREDEYFSSVNLVLRY